MADCQKPSCCTHYSHAEPKINGNNADTLFYTELDLHASKDDM